MSYCKVLPAGPYYEMGPSTAVSPSVCPSIPFRSTLKFRMDGHRIVKLVEKFFLARAADNPIVGQKV